MSAYSFALISVIAQAFKQVAMRGSLKTGLDVWPVLIFYNLAAAVILCLFGYIPSLEGVNLYTGILTVISCFIWVAICLLELKAHAHLDVAVGAVLSTLNFVLIMVGGVFIFNEHMSFPAFLAAALIVASAARTTDISGCIRKAAGQSVGVRYKLTSILLLASNMLLTKYLTTQVDSMTLAVSAFYIPGVIYAAIAPHKINAIPDSIRESKGKVLAIPVFCALNYSAVLKALELGNVSTTYAILQTSVVVVFLFGAALLQERENMLQRGVSCALCAVGAFIICKY